MGAPQNDQERRPPAQKSLLATIGTLIRRTALVVLGIVFGACVAIPLWTYTGTGLLSFGLLLVVFGFGPLVLVRMNRSRLSGRDKEAIAFICVAALIFTFFSWPHLEHHPPGPKGIAAAHIHSLCSASEACHIEYNRWPQPRNAADFVLIFGGLRDPRTGEVVSGKRPALLAQNPQRLPFMDFRAKDVTPPYSSSKSVSDDLAFYDPWGTPYGFAFDNGIGGVYYRGPGTNSPTPWPDTKAGDGVIPLPFASAGGGTNVIRAGCAFFSNGPDGLTGTPETEADDIRSWK